MATGTLPVGSCVLSQVHHHGSSEALGFEHFLCLGSVQSLSPVQLTATPWTAARQASLSIANSWSLLKLTSFELVMPPNRLILCRPLLLLQLLHFLLCPGVSRFPKEPGLLLLEKVLDTKIWALGVLIAPGASLFQLMLLTAHSADRARK